MILSGWGGSGLQSLEWYPRCGGRGSARWPGCTGQGLAQLHRSWKQDQARKNSGGKQKLARKHPGGTQGLAWMHGGGMHGLTRLRGGGTQGLAGRCGSGGQGLVRRAGSGFVRLGLAGMRDHTDNPEVQGGGDVCWAELLDKMAAKSRRPQAREPPETDSAVNASAPPQRLRRWAASAHGLSLGSWSGPDARRAGQHRSWLAP